jgi:hypothetical protein
VKRPVVGFAALAAVLVFAAAGGAFTLNGTIEATDRTQAGFQVAGIASTCAVPQAFPGLFSGSVHYDAYTFTNGSSSTSCVTATLTITSENAHLASAAYLGSFDPSDPSKNYLAFSGGFGNATYSFNVPAGATFIVVVHESPELPVRSKLQGSTLLAQPSGCIGCTYTLEVTGTGVTTLGATFASARATRMAKGIVVRWRTGTEADLLGFQVYRSRGHSWRRITHSLIAARGSVAGASYRFLDKTARRGTAYRYRIKAVDRDGTTSWFGPVRTT